MNNNQTQNCQIRVSRLLTLGRNILGLSLLMSSYFTSFAIAQPTKDADLPTVATIKNLVNGDLKCYVTLVDDSGKLHQSIGATFEVCQNKDTYINKRVSLQYGRIPVSDCQSSEPCGRTRIETLITQMTVIKAQLPMPQINIIGEQEKTRSYNLNVSNSGDILFVSCPQNYAPKLGYLRNVEALQCVPVQGLN